MGEAIKVLLDHPLTWVVAIWGLLLLTSMVGHRDRRRHGPGHPPRED